MECQYIIELAVAGMADGPHSPIVRSERLQRLREHQAAWHSLRWKSERTLPMLDGGVWELYGGVLARAQGRDTLVFTRLPAEIRGISERQWKLTPEGIYAIRDFAMEPAHDLLVLIEETSTYVLCGLHSRASVESFCRQGGLPHSSAMHEYRQTSPTGMQACCIDSFATRSPILVCCSSMQELPRNPVHQQR